MATDHLETVETLNEASDPVEGFRILVTSERAVYTAQDVDGVLTWVLEIVLP